MDRLTTTITHETEDNPDKESKHRASNMAAPLSVTVREAMSTTIGDDESSPTTPTRHSFAGLAGQKPLPDSITLSTPRPGTSDGDNLSQNGSVSFRPEQDNQDVEMGDADDMEDGMDEDGSDNESVTSESQRPSKKKKGQRFFCTEYPPCQLSFTRSEHLARHIRKHTGERPFQCHCSRRFSRLDNLRQHAQTVHVNEEIPGDSLAATSTRFQRQIRTDRVRPPSSRSRASTIGSQGGHSRGHSRNLSASSIGSTTSSVGIPEDIRRRPQPLAMANDPSQRARLSLDTYGSSMANQAQPQQYYVQSPTGYSTPMSTTYSTGASSPHFQSGMTSPTSTISRSSYYYGGRTPSRRLSTPAESSLHPAQTSIYTPGTFSPASSTTSTMYSHDTPSLASPAGSIYGHRRHESESDMEYRRRTWHPSSTSQYAQRPATSGLSYYQTPDQPRPAFSQQAVTASQPTHLPGIESFDHAPLTSTARVHGSPMMDTSSPRPQTAARPAESMLQHGLNKLEITPGQASSDGRWQASQTYAHHPQGYYAAYSQAPPSQTHQYAHPQHVSVPEPPITPRKNKRNAWYGGPIAPTAVTHVSQLAQRPSPEDSGSSDGVSTPSASQSNEYHPIIYSSNNPLSDMLPPGAIMTEEQKAYYNVVQPKPDAIRSDSGYQAFTAPHAPPPQTYTLQTGDALRSPHKYTQPTQQNDMTKLEALVAVATSEGSRSTERH